MQIKNRVKELRHVPAKELQLSGNNWRVHNDEQRQVMTELINTVGFASAIIARETDDGKLEVIDGHLRQEIAEDEEVPVLVLDLNEEEAKYLLATFDPVSDLASGDIDKFQILLNNIEVDTSSIEEFIDNTTVNMMLGTEKLKLKSGKKKKGNKELKCELLVDGIVIPLTSQEHESLLDTLDFFQEKFGSLTGFWQAVANVVDITKVDCPEVRKIVDKVSNQYILEKLNMDDVDYDYEDMFN
jgi:hypothetical protein